MFDKSLAVKSKFNKTISPKFLSALRRSNSVDNASQSSTLKSHQEFNLSGADSDFDVEDEHRPWSARFPTVSHHPYHRSKDFRLVYFMPND